MYCCEIFDCDFFGESNFLAKIDSLQVSIIIYRNVQQAFVMCSLENHLTKGLGINFLYDSLIEPLL